MSPAEPQTSSTTDSVVPFSSVRTVRDKHITRKLLSAVVGGVSLCWLSSNCGHSGLVECAGLHHRVHDVEPATS